jgi:hypothetical protein
MHDVLKILHFGVINSRDQASLEKLRHLPEKRLENSDRAGGHWIVCLGVAEGCRKCLLARKNPNALVTVVLR